MITKNKAQAILTKHAELLDLAYEYVKTVHPSKRHGSVTIDYNWDICEEINTSCNCHPEYNYVTRATFEEFGKWLDERKK